MEPTPLRDGRRRSVGIQHHKENSDLGRVLRCPYLQVRIVPEQTSSRFPAKQEV